MSAEAGLAWDGIGWVDPGGVYWLPTNVDVITLSHSLRELHRLKIGVDYGYRRKYGKLLIFCEPVYRDKIQTTATEMGLTIEFA